MTLLYIFAFMAIFCGVITFVAAMYGAAMPTIERSEWWTNLAVEALTCSCMFLTLAIVGLFFV